MWVIFEREMNKKIGDRVWKLSVVQLTIEMKITDMCHFSKDITRQMCGDAAFLRFWIIFFHVGSHTLVFVCAVFHCQFAFNWSLFSQSGQFLLWVDSQKAGFFFSWIQNNRDTTIQMVYVFGSSSSSRTIESRKKTEMNVSGYEMHVNLQWKGKRRFWTREWVERGIRKHMEKKCR